MRHYAHVVQRTHRSTMAKAWAIAAMLIGLAACGPQPGSATSAAGADGQVRAASAAWDEAHDSGDASRLTQLYSESAVSMPYGRPAIEGRSAIEADFREFFAAHTARHKTSIVSVEVLGDWAIERGKYEFSATPKAGGTPMRESGKHIVVRRNIAGTWKVQWEIWNTDAPVPGS
jgi:uncharacterized protein (TIGR02246 family)